MNPDWESNGVSLYLGDCLEILPTFEAGSVDAIVTDPPYGCGKADWDDDFPQAWYSEAKRIARMIAIITGSSGLKDVIPLVGHDFIDIIAARNLNGMTRSPAGFGNWLACTIAQGKPPQGITFFEFAIRGKMPNHPSPKPIEYMQCLLERLGAQTILDPFMGSGTTGAACVQRGHRFIGIEIDPNYFEIAKQRIIQAQSTPRLL